MTVKRKAPAADRVRASIAALNSAPDTRYLLAVSGGRDSMVLLDAFASTRADIAAVATFNHGTGPAATRAAEHVEFEAARRGLPCVSGHAARRARGRAPARAQANAQVNADAALSPGEQALRTERWAFLNAWAEEFNATVVTAHTEDDQVETVFIRILRDSGARGLAGMYAPSPIARPLLAVSRDDIAAYADVHGVRWIEDPSNASPRYLRNRVRLELLPAIMGVHPHFRAWLLHVSRDAATWRAEVAALVDSLGATTGDRATIVPAGAFAGVPPEVHGAVWAELAARAGVTLDWRGLERLMHEAGRLRVGGTIPLSGGAVVERTVSTYVVRNSGASARLY